MILSIVGCDNMQAGLPGRSSVDGFPFLPAALQILDGAENALPDRYAYDVPGQPHFIDALGGPCGGMRSVMRDQ